jgi:hypothetical protein
MVYYVPKHIVSIQVLVGLVEIQSTFTPVEDNDPRLHQTVLQVDAVQG